MRALGRIEFDEEKDGLLLTWDVPPDLASQMTDAHRVGVLAGFFTDSAAALGLSEQDMIRVIRMSRRTVDAAQPTGFSTEKPSRGLSIEKIRLLRNEEETKS
jgi:hypothetical protein